MKMLCSFTRVFLVCSFFYASLCFLSLSWADDVPPTPGSVNLLQTDNATKVNTSDSGVMASDSAIVQSSFEEIPLDSAGSVSPQDFAFADAASQNSGVFNEITDTGQAAVFTLTDAATAELQQRADIPSAITSHNETPNLNGNDSAKDDLIGTKLGIINATIDSDMENRSEEITDTQQTEKLDLDVPITEPKENLTEKNEDIPSFSEWAQKQLEEAEKKKELVNTSSQNANVNGKANSNLKVRSKNYASPDCGAKIIAANPESVSASAILSSSRDEYKLNACTNRIWFIVELCEAIQAKKIDLANFELFSSSPKDFSVHVSDRFPSRDWSNVGQFTAKDEREVQGFDLHPHLFGKYIKVELHSHHGSEHFCPISLFRVYGTSEFEVLEKEDQAHGSAEDDDDDDEILDTDNGQPSKNLFSSATDAVISIVKKAAEVLGNKANNSNQTSEEDGSNKLKPTRLRSTCVTPSHLIVCDNCSDTMFDDVYELMSCRSKLIYDLVNLHIIGKSLYHTNACQTFGLHFQSKSTVTETNLYTAYVYSFFSEKYLAALCNAMAVIENKVVLNISKQIPNITKDIPADIHVIETIEPNTILSIKTPNKTEEVKTSKEVTSDVELPTSATLDETDTSYMSQIKPTKTLSPDNTSHTSVGSKDDIKTLQPSESVAAQNQFENVIQENTDVHIDLDVATENFTDFEVTTESTENLDLDLISELNNLGSASNPNTPATPSATPQVKETVFLRLLNRMKALERNVSLSSQYLEELSKLCKKQVEQMQRVLSTLNEESRKVNDHIRQQEEQLQELKMIVHTLVKEKAWVTTTFWLFLIMVLTFGICIFCRRSEYKCARDDGASVTIQRRKSIDVVSHSTPSKKERRPSEEALKISGTYKDLMMEDIDSKKKFKEKKKRKKKTSINRSNSITVLEEEKVEDLSERTTGSDIVIQIRPSDVSHKKWTRQESAPAKFADLDTNITVKSPYFLEESDNSPLESLPIPKPLLTQVPVDETNGNVPTSTKIKDIKPPSFMKTAGESRSKRNSSPNGQVDAYVNTAKHEVHKKSSSLGEIKRQSSPVPSVGTGSLNMSYDPVKPITPKKEKKSGIKRIFRKVF